MPVFMVTREIQPAPQEAHRAALQYTAGCSCTITAHKGCGATAPWQRSEYTCIFWATDEPS